ncbi:MAG: hypothetical protein HUK02_03875 [Bacteroidaceae bacterium]|nr:hypothetical protein [Bacteroidaceae bacterium]
MKKIAHTPQDPQADKVLKGLMQSAVTPPSLPAEAFTRRVVASLPSRRRHRFLLAVLAFVQSPFWTLLALIVCAVVSRNHLTGLLHRLTTLSHGSLTLVFLAGSAVVALLFLSLFRDTQRMVDRLS